MRFSLTDRSAAQFGSEGQKRTLPSALKMSQAEYLAGFTAPRPSSSSDDVMGELDVKRRSGFPPAGTHHHSRQVF